MATARIQRAQSRQSRPSLLPSMWRRGAAKLGLDVMSAAIDRRLRSPWADEADPVVEALRTDNPEELDAARALVRLHLGSQRQWRIKAQAVWDQQLAGTLARGRAGGHFLTCRARVPVMPNLRGPWLNELREDVVNATLVAFLQNKGIAVDPRTAAAARWGRESIQVASKAVGSLNA